MAMNSVNTNQGAMIALQNLNTTNKDLGVVQNRVNTGLKIASAKDNGAIWAIAQNQRAESTSLNAVVSSLQRGQSVADVAMSAGTAISDILDRLQASPERRVQVAARSDQHDRQQRVVRRREPDLVAGHQQLEHQGDRQR
jgi:flagellin